MRIVGGQWRSRRLLFPNFQQTRPTQDRVREAIFNILMSRLGKLDGTLIVDVFAGSGSMGLEALSRGARMVLFAESHIPTRNILQKNIENFQCFDQVQIFSSFLDFSDAACAVDIIFLDPPYGYDLEYKALQFLSHKKYIGPKTLIVLETDSTSIPSTLLANNHHIAEPLIQLAERRFGRCGLSFWQLQND